jgi:hypothetical protein
MQRRGACFVTGAFFSLSRSSNLDYYEEMPLLGGHCGIISSHFIFVFFIEASPGYFSECSHMRRAADHRGCHMLLTKSGKLHWTTPLNIPLEGCALLRLHNVCIS